MDGASPAPCTGREIDGTFCSWVSSCPYVASGSSTGSLPAQPHAVGLGKVGGNPLGCGAGAG